MMRSLSLSLAGKRRTTLRMLALLWVLVIFSLSLYPYEGWRWPPLPPWGFLTQPLPRYRTPFDLWTNLLAYVPLGVLLAGSLPGRVRAWVCIILVVFATGVLSIGMEFAQAFLPTRRAQWLDVVANLSGGGLGALTWLGLFRRHALPAQALYRGMPARTPPWSHLGPLLVLLVVWWFAQASPMPLWLSMGASPLWTAGPWLLVAEDSGWHILLEALIVGLSLSGLCLLIACSLRAEDSLWGRWVHRHPSGTLGLTLLIALGLRLLWVMLLGHALAEPVSDWFSPGVQAGLVLAGLLSAAALSLSPRIRTAALLGLLASALLLSQTVSLLGQPPMAVWASGPWLNLRGLAQASAAIWPFLALGWTVLLLVQRHNRWL